MSNMAKDIAMAMKRKHKVSQVLFQMKNRSWSMGNFEGATGNCNQRWSCASYYYMRSTVSWELNKSYNLSWQCV